MKLTDWSALASPLGSPLPADVNRTPHEGGGPEGHTHCAHGFIFKHTTTDHQNNPSAPLTTSHFRDVRLGVFTVKTPLKTISKTVSEPANEELSVWCGQNTEQNHL